MKVLLKGLNLVFLFLVVETPALVRKDIQY